MLKNLLNIEIIQVVEQAKDWREAVAVSCRPLIENGSTEPHYVDVIYRSCNIIDPYYVVDPGIVILHAHPEEEVNKLSLTLTLIPSGVDSDADENDPVKLLIALATTDSTSHIEAIFQLARLFDNEKDIQAVLMARVTQGILSIIARY